MAIAEDSYLRRPDEMSVATLGVEGVNKALSKDGPELLAIPNAVRLRTGRLIIPIHNEGGDLGKLHEIFSGRY